MTRLTAALTCLLAAFPSCRHASQFGNNVADGAGYITRPVATGTKKLASATATGSRAVANATVTGSRKLAGATISGARSLAAGATRLVTFGSANRKPAPAPLAARSENAEQKGLPPIFQFPNRGLLVTGAELGTEATRLQATAVNLAGGWVLNGNEVAYVLPPGADDPTALLVRGTPATALLTSDSGTTTGSARELHYHSANQILTLKGNPQLSSAGSVVEGTSSGTLIKIHLPTGSISVEGGARWGG